MRRRIIGGRYQIQAEIGSGGMGTVYRARDRRTGITVAVKLLHAHLAQDETYLERFRREARIATSLDSPHVVKVLDYGEDQGVPFIVMEFVAGKDLRRILRERGCVAESEALAIAAQVVDALGKAHRKGVVHRDIKPQNIIVTPDGTVKVADFGIARAEDYSTVSQTGAFFGTVQYAAPEHFQGQFDIRSDIYSLGVVLYHMLSGSPPFSGDTLLEVMRLHVEEPPAPLRARVPSVSRETDAIVGRCLSKSPSERFQSPDELSATIGSILPPEPLDIASAVSPPRGRFPRLGTLAGWWKARSIGFKVAGPGVVALLVCGASLGAAAGLGIWNPGEPSSTPAVVATATPVPPWELAYVDPLGNLWVSTADGSESKQITFDGAAAHPAWSPDGGRIALVRKVGPDQENPTATQLFTIDVNSGLESQIRSALATMVPGSDKLVRNPRWSQDGAAILYQSDDVLDENTFHRIRWRLLQELDQNAFEEGEASVLPEVIAEAELDNPGETAAGRMYSFDVSSKDGSVAYQTCDESLPPNCGIQLQMTKPMELVTYPTADGSGGYHRLAAESTKSLVPIVGGDYFWAPTFSPDGDRIAYYGQVAGETAVFTMNLSDGSVSRVATVTANNFSPSSLWSALAWSADGSKILYESDGAIWAVEVGRQSAQPSRFVEGKHPSWLHRRAAPVEPTAVTAGSEARSVPVETLLRSGAAVDNVLYGELTGDSTEEILVLSSVARAPYDEQYLDVFSYDAHAGKWIRTLDGAEWPAPTAPLLPARPEPPFRNDVRAAVDTLDLVDVTGDGRGEIVLGVNYGYGNWGVGSVWVIGFDAQEASILYRDFPDTGSILGGSTVRVRTDGRLVVTAPYWQPADAHAAPSQMVHQLVGYDAERGRVAVLTHEKTVYSPVRTTAYDLFSSILGAPASKLPDTLVAVSEEEITLEHYRLGTAVIGREQLRQALAEYEEPPWPRLTCRAVASQWEADPEAQGVTWPKAQLILDGLAAFYYDLLVGDLTTEETRRESAEDILTWTVLEFTETDGQWRLSSLIVGDREVLSERYRVSGNSEGCPVAGIDYDASMPTPMTSAPTPAVTPSPTATPIPAPTATPALGGRIAFTSYRVWDWDGEIYVMNADGTDQTPLTINPAWDWKPAWSPDSSKIAFGSDRDGNWEVYVMNADGTGQARLTTNPTYDLHPAWSPDGSKIAFESDRDGNWEVYVMNADGTGQTRLTTDPTADLSPAWSPDGSKIAFESDRDGNDEIYVMNGDGTNQIRLTTSPTYDRNPVWSPDGSKIAFDSDRDDPYWNYEIYVMNANGSDQRRLTNNSAGDESPAWSPDGSRIAFASFRNGYKIYVMNADGTGETCLTKEPLDGSDPAWAP